MDRERLLTRIESLLRLSRSDNEHEADTALKAAHRLSLKHKIDLHDLDPDREERESLVTRLKKEARVSTARKYIATLLSDYFSVRVVFVGGRKNSSSHIVLLGFDQDAKVAALVLDWLVKEFAVRWKRRKESGGTQRRAYYAGLVAGLRVKLEESKKEVEAENPQSFAIVVASTEERLKVAVREAFPDLVTLKTKKVTGRNDYHTGIAEGREMEIPNFSKVVDPRKEIAG